MLVADPSTDAFTLLKLMYCEAVLRGGEGVWGNTKLWLRLQRNARVVWGVERRHGGGVGCLVRGELVYDVDCCVRQT